jgi:hypothetical protein
MHNYNIVYYFIIGVLVGSIIFSAIYDYFKFTQEKKDTDDSKFM